MTPGWRITIECPDCHAELTTPLQGSMSSIGGFNCNCGLTMRWQVNLDRSRANYGRQPKKGGTSDERKPNTTK